MEISSFYITIGLLVFCSFFNNVKTEEVNVEYETTNKREINETELSVDEKKKKKLERTVMNLQIEEADKENKRNVTFVNGTGETGFMPSFHLGSIDSFPATVVQLTNETGRQEDTDISNRQNSRFPFNNVRMIKFGSDSDQVNDQQKQQQTQLAYRPSEKIKNIVKFVEQTRQGYQENFGSQKNQDINQHHSTPIGTSESPTESYQTRYHHLHHLHTNPDERYNNKRPSLVTYWITPTTSNSYAIQHPSAILLNENLYAPATLEHPQYPTDQVEHYYHTYVPNLPNHHPPYYPPELLHYGQFHTDNHQISTHEIHTRDKANILDTKLETSINVHPISDQATSLDGISHPKTIIYVTTHKTPKISGSGSLQTIGHTDTTGLTPENMEHHFPSIFNNHVHETKSVSPWRKILHVIGTFLPLGLLIALLSPHLINSNAVNSISHDRNNEPNVILSKLRVNDLPAEHKNNQFSALDTGLLGKAMECEEKSVCRLLANTDSVGYNFLRYLLLQIVERTSDSVVRKKELVKIFEAVRLKKCDTLTCNFYDGT